MHGGLCVLHIVAPKRGGPLDIIKTLKVRRSQWICVDLCRFGVDSCFLANLCELCLCSLWLPRTAPIVTTKRGGHVDIIKTLKV